MSGSLRRRLVLGTATGTAVALVLSACLLYGLFRADLLRGFDRALEDRARLLTSAVTREPTGLEFDFGDLDMREFLPGAEASYFEVWGGNGAALYRSRSLGGTDLLRPPDSLDDTMYADIELPGDVDGRSVALRFRPRVEEDDEGAAPSGGDAVTAELTLVLARGTGTTTRVLGRLGLVLLAVVLVTIVVVAGTLVVVIDRSLKPIEVLTDRISGLDHRALSEQLPEAGVPEEFRPVVHRLNELLDRLDRAFRREQAFSADAAHELRTPLAGLRSTIEVALSRPREPEEYRSALGRCLEASAHLEDLVSSLLSLARIETGALHVGAAPVSLDGLLREAWEPFRALAAERRLVVRWDESPGRVDVRTDAALLATALRNVVDNAVRYADEGGRITLGVTGDKTHGVIRVSNTGCRLTQEEAEELRDRFRRGDEARSASDANFGLGLALVGAILDVLQGDLQVRANPDGNYEAIIRLPYAPDGTRARNAPSTIRS